MTKSGSTTKRVLARQLARVLTVEDLQAVASQGTSYGGTMCDGDGKARDIEGRDCVNGGDTFAC
jgi:hypothetical protein